LISRFLLAQLPFILTEVTLLWGLSRWRGKGEKHPLASAGRSPGPRSERRLGLGWKKEDTVGVRKLWAARSRMPIARS